MQPLGAINNDSSCEFLLDSRTKNVNFLLTIRRMPSGPERAVTQYAMAFSSHDMLQNFTSDAVFCRAGVP